jgi:hypothetical protein
MMGVSFLLSLIIGVTLLICYLLVPVAQTVLLWRRRRIGLALGAAAATWLLPAPLLFIFVAAMPSQVDFPSLVLWTVGLSFALWPVLIFVLVAALSKRTIR